MIARLALLLVLAATPVLSGAWPIDGGGIPEELAVDDLGGRIIQRDGAITVSKVGLEQTALDGQVMPRLDLDRVDGVARGIPLEPAEHDVR